MKLFNGSIVWFFYHEFTNFKLDEIIICSSLMNMRIKSNNYAETLVNWWQSYFKIQLHPTGSIYNDKKRFADCFESIIMT